MVIYQREGVAKGNLKYHEKTSKIVVSFAISRVLWGGGVNVQKKVSPVGITKVNHVCDFHV